MNPAIDHFRKKFEPGILILLLLLSTGLNAPSTVKTAANALIYLAVPFLVICERKRIIPALIADIPLLILTIYTAASSIWSATPDTTLILVRALILRTLLGIYLAVQYSPKEQLQILNWVFGIAAVLSIGLSGRQGSAWTGFFGQKNELARIMAVGALLCVSSVVANRKRWRYAAALFGLSVLLLMLSQGRSSLVIFLLALTGTPILYWLLGQSYKVWGATLPAGLALLGTSTALIVNNYEFIIVELLNKPLDLNGRIPLWTYLISRGVEKLWLGYGYGAFYNIPDEVYGVVLHTWYGSLSSLRAILLTSGMANTHSHSGFLDLFLGLGLVGLLLFLLSFITILFRLFKLFRSPHHRNDTYWMLSFLIFMVLLNSTITGTILHPKHLFWIMYVMVGFSSAIQVQQLEKRKNDTAVHHLEYDAVLLSENKEFR